MRAATVALTVAVLAAVVSPIAAAETSAATANDWIDPSFVGAAELSGTVTSADGVPLKTSYVNLFDADSTGDTPIAGGQVDSNGDFDFEGIAEGEYLVRAIGDPFDYDWVTQWWRHSGSQATATTVTVADEPVILPALHMIKDSDAHFADVSGLNPFFYSIEWMNTRGLSTGYVGADGTVTYRPLEAVSRQATAAFLYRYIDDTDFVTPTTPTFSDVPTTHPFFREIEWMAANDIATGNADGTFAPNAPVSRQAMAAFLSRLSNLPTPDPATPSFTDVGHDNPFYGEIEWVASVGIAKGYADGGFHPTDPVSRQAMAAFLDRYDALH
ncbi:S-layer homology domain-containing protein [Microbacteriaceae bacterium VKM Ac-2854]|nr:S-layer homology domain-containing protein [Microbacteriaceae bacterium VKM Ac-2854]